MTLEADIREAAGSGRLLELNLRPVRGSDGKPAWKASAGMATDPRMLIGIDACPVSAIRKALLLEQNDLFPSESGMTDDTTEDIFS